VHHHVAKSLTSSSASWAKTGAVSQKKKWKRDYSGNYKSEFEDWWETIKSAVQQVFYHEPLGAVTLQSLFKQSTSQRKTLFKQWST
jgi:hypothetical protein